MLKELAGDLVNLGRRAVGFEERAFIRTTKTEWEWNPRKFARNALIVLGVLLAKEAVPPVVSAIDRATAPSLYSPSTALEEDMDGGIRKGNLLSLLLILNNHPPADQLLFYLEEKNAREYSITPQYPFADAYTQGKPDQTVYLLDIAKQTNLGPLKVTKDKELYVYAVSSLVDRYKITNTTDVTRINGEVANEYLIAQPYYDDENNIPSSDKKSKPGELKVRFLAVGRWNDVTGDVDWGDDEINATWQSLPTSGMLIPANIPGLPGLGALPTQGVLPFLPSGVLEQLTWRDKITQMIGTIRPFHQTENLPSPLNYLNRPKTPTPESSLLKSGVPIRGRPRSFGNTGLPKSVILNRQKLG